MRTMALHFITASTHFSESSSLWEMAEVGDGGASDWVLSIGVSILSERWLESG